MSAMGRKRSTSNACLRPKTGILLPRLAALKQSFVAVRRGANPQRLGVLRAAALAFIQAWQGGAPTIRLTCPALATWLSFDHLDLRTMLDRLELEQRACECYTVIRKECDRLLSA